VLDGQVEHGGAESDPFGLRSLPNFDEAMTINEIRNWKKP
jgi:hypothetical protein